MAVSALAPAVVRADEIVFDNTTTFLNQHAAIVSEYGDEIDLGGVARTVTQFAFEYRTIFESQGDEVARVRFYANDGLRFDSFRVRPGTLIYESGLIPLRSGFASVTLSDINRVVPSTFTWSIEISGVRQIPGDEAGLLYYSPPTVGSSFDEFWLNDPTEGWIPVFTDGVKDNFNARVTAVPEPSTLALAAAGLALLGVARPGRGRRG